MALEHRTLIQPGRIMVARDGVNVLNPPDNTPEYLVFDSNWPKVERIHPMRGHHTIAVVKGTALINPRVINFDELREPPFARLDQRKDGWIYDLDVIDREIAVGSSGVTEDVQAQKYIIQFIQKDRAQIKQVAGSDENGTPTFDDARWDFVFIALKP